MHELIQFFLNITSDLGYTGVLILMTIESSFVPFPSEIVIPPAAYLASKGEMNIYLVVFFGALGSLIGATINYVLAMSLGRTIVYNLADTKIAKIFLINKKKIEKSEDYFTKYGYSSTFLGRFVPAVRQLISIPAGFVRLNYFYFLLFTLLGSGSWVTVLALLGYHFGANEELLAKYYTDAVFVAVAFVLFVLVLVVLFRLNGRKKA